MNGPILFKLRHKSLSLGFKFEAEDRDGEILFTLSQELSCKSTTTNQMESS
jgi:hypothetical protein